MSFLQTIHIDLVEEAKTDTEKADVVVEVQTSLKPAAASSLAVSKCYAIAEELPIQQETQKKKELHAERMKVAETDSESSAE
jgi:hypothetical protein